MRSNLLLATAAVALLAAPAACSVADLHPPAGCHADADCPADARCHLDTCTADLPPRAIIAGPRTGAAGAPLVFDGGESSDADDDIVAYTWSVHLLSGDCPPDLGASGQSAFHPTFACAGEYEVLLVVRDRAGVLSEPAIAPVTITR